MINWTNDPANIAKAQVDKWFGTSTLGAVFLSADGRAYPVSGEEREILKQKAAADVLVLHKRMTTRAYLVIFLVVLLFLAFNIGSTRFEAPVSTVIRNIGYAVYSAHGVWIFYEAYRHDRNVKDVRHGMTNSMAARVPLPGAITSHMTSSNPFQAFLVAIVIALFVFYLAAETLAHRGIDLISVVPPWAYLAFVPFVWGLYFLAQFFDRRRGIGS